MRQKILAVIILTMAFLTSAASAAAVPAIDGVISPGEWDAYFLGTSVTGFGGGMYVGVYGFSDGTYVYAAYVANTSQPGWATTCASSIPPNFSYKTPQSAVYPAQGFTLFEMTYDVNGSTPNPTIDVQHTDGVGFVGNGTKAANGITRAWTQPVPGASCLGGLAGENIAEFKIPISLLAYAGDNGQMGLSGQYLQYGFDDQAFFTIINPPVIVEPTKDSKVALAQASANFGTGRYMMVNDKKNAVDRSYLGFNLSAFAHPSVSNAELRIYVFQTGNTAVGSAIEAWHCSNADFNELTINWKNQPAAWKPNGLQVGNKCALADSFSVANKVMYGLPETFHSWDLTSEVNSALAGNKSFTVVLKHDTETAATNKNYVQYLTRDYPESDFR